MRSVDVLGFAKSDRFVLRRALGEGGTGVVYEAFDKDIGAVVALKTLRHVDPSSLYRFKQEFREAQDLHHPNLVTLFDLIADEGQWFFTMELVDGVDFMSYVRPDSFAPFDEARLRAALEGLARGLSALHASGKVHRDIKPSNVLVTREGRVVLLDFGLLFDTRAQLPDDALAGTVGYMAPEQAAAEAVGPAADWYAVGAMLFEALTGHAAFDGDVLDVLQRKRAREAAPSPRRLLERVPMDLDVLCTELLSPDPASRPGGRDVLSRIGASEGRLEAAPASTQFIGREKELAELWEAFTESREAVRVALVYGESGVGKSALVRELLDRVTREGEPAAVLSGRCFEREQVPYKGFDGVVDALARFLAAREDSEAASLLPDDARLLGRVFSVFRSIPRVAAMSEPPGAPVDAHEARRRAFRALRELLARIAKTRAVVVFVDDFQWADADSRALARELLAPPDAPPILLVLTSRDAAIDELPLAPRMVHLGGLSADESRALVAALREEEAPAVDSQAIAQETGGHPLFIQELVRHAAPHDARVRLDDALWARIAALPPAARDLLELLAVAEAPLPPAALARAAEMDPATHAKHLAELRRAHLVKTSGAQGGDAAETYHDRIRAAVLAHLEDDTRRQHHARLARALEQPEREEERGAERDHLALARHLEGAGEASEAARHARLAAKAAEDALAFDRAAELYRTALRLGERSGPDETRALQRKLGQALANAGRGIEAADAYLAAAEGGDDENRAVCTRRAATLLVGSGDIERGVKTLEAALAELGDRLPSSPARAIAGLLWNRARLRLRGLAWRGGAPARVDARAAARLEAFDAVATCFGMIDPVCGADYQARALLLALDMGDAKRVARALALEAIYLASQGSLARARTIGEEAAKVALEADDASVTAMARAAEGILAYYACDYLMAREVLLDAERLYRDETTGTAWELGTVRMFRLGTLAAVGLFAELDRSVDEALRDASRRDDRYAASTMVRMFNVVWLARDLPEEGLRLIEEKAWAPPSGRYHVQHFFELMARIETDLYLGDVSTTRARLGAEIAALERSLLMRMQTARAHACWILGRLAASEGDIAGARSYAARLAREDLPSAAVCASLLRASAATADGDDAAALEHLDDAITGGVSADLLCWSAVARRRRGELVGGDEGAALVREADLWLAAQGVKRPRRFAGIVTPPFR